MMKKQFIFSIEVVSIYCKSYIYGMYGLCVQGEVVGFSGTGYDVRSVIGHCISMGLVFGGMTPLKDEGVSRR